MCLLRCIYSLDNLSFRIYLIFSRHHPTISQLFVRFKSPTTDNSERLKSLQSDIRTMFDETSHQCFYRGQLCLPTCLMKLKNLFDLHFEQEKLCSIKLRKLNTYSSSGMIEIDSNDDFITYDSSKTNHSRRNRAFATSSSSSSIPTSSSQTAAVASSDRYISRQCGARFGGSTHLVCFGRVANSNQLKSASVLTALNDETTNQPQMASIHSASLTITNTRENSNTNEQLNYESVMKTDTVRIQCASNSQTLPMSSVPAHSSFDAIVSNDDRRTSASSRRSVRQVNLPQSTVSIYDISILLPVSRKLAEDYTIDLNDPVSMCETNQKITQKMDKNDLSRCWHLLGDLLSLQSNLQPDDPWLQTPIAQGIFKNE